jgi:hypothetical protein
MPLTIENTAVDRPMQKHEGERDSAKAGECRRLRAAWRQSKTMAQRPVPTRAVVRRRDQIAPVDRKSPHECGVCPQCSGAPTRLTPRRMNCSSRSPISRRARHAPAKVRSC